MHEINGSEEDFIRFRVRMTLTLSVIVVVMTGVMIGISYLDQKPDWGPAVIISCLLLYWASHEAVIMRRVRSGAFGTGVNDEDMWRQYVRFRDKLPGRFLNRD